MKLDSFKTKKIFKQLISNSYQREGVSKMAQKSISTAVVVSQAGHDVTPIVSDSLGKKVVAAAFALVLASIIIGATGFAPGYAHNAAHDTRHVMVFPCH